MNLRKKQLICLLVVAFLVIFAKAVYAADAKGVTISCNPSELKTTDTNKTVEFIVEINFPDELVAGFSGELVYNPDDIKIVSVKAANRPEEDIDYWTAGLNGNKISALAGIGEKCPEALKIKATVLNESGAATISIQNIQYATLDPETYDTEDIDYPALTVNIAKEISLDVPTGTGYQEGNEDPTPSTVTEEPTQEPTQEVTQIADNGSTGNVNVVDNTATPTPSKTTDGTKANKKIPQTGANLVIYAIIGGALFGSVLLYKKYSNK